MLSVANVAVQTNEGQIDYLRKKKDGVGGIGGLGRSWVEAGG